MLAALAAAVHDTVPRVAFNGGLEAAIMLAPLASPVPHTVPRVASS